MDDLITQTKGLTRRLKNVIAVEDLTLSVRRGATFELVGADGAGKTTTIRMLAAIMNPSQGSATVAGFDAVDEPEPIEECIHYVAHQFNLYGDLTVIENLHFFADVFGVRGAERKRRVQRLLEFARLTEFKGWPAAHLTGGMQKKLSLAWTLIHQPDLLLLDEPTTGVDPVSRREFWDILTHLHLQGVTLLVSTPCMDKADAARGWGSCTRGT